jgi:hypothetical protein
VNYLDEITDFLLLGLPSYSIAVCDKTINILQSNLSSCKSSTTKSYLQNAQSALYKFRDYLSSIAIKPIFTPVIPGSKKTRIAKTSLNGSIDGLDTLIGILSQNGVDFIKLAIESSLFFSADIVDDRCNNLSIMFSCGANVPARHTTDKDICSETVKGAPAIYNIGGKSYKVDVDKDGNDFVRKLINDYTGYTVSTGKSSIITGYVISHVWGRAFDPRYFTSMWNIVLIPSWANTLMDVVNPVSGSYASRLQNTIMEICKKLYSGAVSCSIPSSPVTKDIVHGTYDISIINSKNGMPLGPITRQTVII